MRMKKDTMNTTKAVITGVVLGTVFGMAANSMIKNQDWKIKRTACRALNTVGETMQNISTRIK